MAEERTFSYPPSPQDRLLAGAGQLERLVRGVARQVTSGRLLAWQQAWRRWPRGSPADAVPARADALPALRPPVLYFPAVAWNYRFQRPQHLALALARAGHPVLYVDGFLRSRLLPARRLIPLVPGLDLLQVRVPGRPDPYRQVLTAPAARQMAQTIGAGLGAERPLMVFVQLPFWGPLGRELARRLEVPLVYDRIDLHTGFPGVPKETAAAETELIRAADLVCATSGMLAEGSRELNSNLLFLPNAVDFPAFVPAPRSPAERLKIGYVGALGPWFHTAAVREAALRHPDWDFHLAGEIEDPAVAALAELPNVELLGEIPFRAVAPFLAGLDVAVVPFRDLPLTRAVDPVKLYEALAMGLPVVSRRLPETERWAEPLVYLYDSAEGFVGQLERALAERSPQLAGERRHLAAGESWDCRSGELLKTVGGLSPQTR